MVEHASRVAQARLNRTTVKRLEGEASISIDQAYLLQRSVNAILAGDLGTIGGSKIGASNEALKKYLGVDEPLVGEIFTETIHHSPATLRLADYQEPGLETEIGVRLGHEVKPGSEWRTAIQSMHAAIEIVDNRYGGMDRAGAQTFVADNMFNAASIIGPAVTDFCKLDLENLEARTIIDGITVEKGTSAALMGGPMQTLDWVFDLWRRQERTMPKGWFISLGTMTMVQWLEAPSHLRIEVAGLGEVECRLK